MIPSNLQYANQPEQTPKINDKVSFKLPGEDSFRQGRLVTDGLTTYVIYRESVKLENIETLNFKEHGEQIPS